MPTPSLSQLKNKSALREKMKTWAETHVAEMNARRQQRERTKANNRARHHAAQLLAAVFRAAVQDKDARLADMLDAIMPALMALTAAGTTAPKWMDTPEKRRLAWTCQAVAAVLRGDAEQAAKCGARASAEDAACKGRLLKDCTLLPAPG